MVVLAFGLAGFFAYKKIKKDGLPVWMSSFQSFKKQLSVKNWTLNPLGVPSVLIISISLITMHLFLATVPVIGFFIGMIAWYYVPFFYVLYKGSNADKYSKRGKIVSIIFWVGFIALLMFLFSMI
jgi:maltodextrin utilization protein YvdJ